MSITSENKIQFFLCESNHGETIIYFYFSDFVCYLIFAHCAYVSNDWDLHQRLNGIALGLFCPVFFCVIMMRSSEVTLLIRQLISVVETIWWVKIVDKLGFVVNALYAKGLWLTVHDHFELEEVIHMVHWSTVFCYNQNSNINSGLLFTIKSTFLKVFFIMLNSI